jgi:hypothetical protein
MTTRSLKTFIVQSTDLATIQQAAKRIAAMQQLFSQCIATDLAPYCRVIHYFNGQITVLASNSAIAAKLKQLAPTLLKRLEKQRPEVNGIRIQVQVTDLAPKSPPKSVKKPLTIDSIQEFESLSSQVKDQHLREALIKFAKRQRGDG